MYGMVNNSLESMIREVYGDDVWLEVKRAAGVDVDVFINNDGYPDEMTFRLVVAAAERTLQSTDLLLREFGAYWVQKTARIGYGDILASCGRTLQEFLCNLPHLHTRVALLFPELSPPEFACTNIQPDSLRLIYRSSRQGLTYFVIGLIEGLGTMFNTTVSVSPIPEAHRPGYEEFDIRWTQRVGSIR